MLVSKATKAMVETRSAMDAGDGDFGEGLARCAGSFEASCKTLMK